MTRPVIAVYREEWLPFSETFIRDHVLGLRRYAPLGVGGRLTQVPLETPGVPVRDARSGTRLARATRSLRRRAGVPEHALRSAGLYSVLREVRPRLVHAHFGVDGAVALAATRRARLPLVVTFHGYDASTDLDRLAASGPTSAYFVRELPRLLGGAGAIIAVSQALRDTLVRRGADPGVVSVIPCGVDTSRFSFSPPPPDGPILFVGRLVAKKGLGDLLDALSGMAQPPPVRVLGDGPLRGQLTERARSLGLDVTFEGQATSEQVRSALQSSRLVAIPSKTAPNGDTEGLPVMSLEAAASGRPVVGYAHAGLNQSVVDGVTGDLAPEGDVRLLRGALERLLTDPSRLEAYASAGRRHVSQHFELVDKLAEVEQVYDRVLGDGPLTMNAEELRHDRT